MNVQTQAKTDTRSPKTPKTKLPILPLAGRASSDCGDGSCGCGCGLPIIRQ